MLLNDESSFQCIFAFVLTQAKQRSLGRPFPSDTTAEDQQQEISR